MRVRELCEEVMLTVVVKCGKMCGKKQQKCVSQSQMRCFVSELKIGELTDFQVQKDSKCQSKMAVNAVEMSAVVKAVKLLLKE